MWFFNLNPLFPETKHQFYEPSDRRKYRYKTGEKNSNIDTPTFPVYTSASVGTKYEGITCRTKNRTPHFVVTKMTHPICEAPGIKQSPSPDRFDKAARTRGTKWGHVRTSYPYQPYQFCERNSRTFTNLVTEGTIALRVRYDEMSPMEV